MAQSRRDKEGAHSSEQTPDIVDGRGMTCHRRTWMVELGYECTSTGHAAVQSLIITEQRERASTHNGDNRAELPPAKVFDAEHSDSLHSSYVVNAI